jgi:hypothetical protein
MKTRSSLRSVARRRLVAPHGFLSSLRFFSQRTCCRPRFPSSCRRRERRDVSSRTC